MIQAWFDGAVEPHNPSGHGGIGVVVRRDSEVIYTEASYMGRWNSLSNNCAEYAAVIAALRYLLREGITEATVYGDADMVVNQLNGKWRVKGGAYVPYFREAYTLRSRLPQVSIQWIPREMNCAADDLSKVAVGKRVIGFNLDSTIELIPQPEIKSRKRNRRRQQSVLVNEDDEAWQMFKIRYGDL